MTPQRIDFTDDEHREHCKTAGCWHAAVYEFGPQGWCARCRAVAFGGVYEGLRFEDGRIVRDVIAILGEYAFADDRDTGGVTEDEAEEALRGVHRIVATARRVALAVEAEDDDDEVADSTRALVDAVRDVEIAPGQPAGWKPDGHRGRLRRQ